MTSASAGIGFSICEEPAVNGVHLVMVARTHSRLEEMTTELARRYGVTTLPVASDVTDANFPRQTVRQAEQYFREIDLLVNNAGRVHTSKLLTTAD